MKTKRLITVSIALLTTAACTEVFEPKGPYEERLVVFAILTSVKDTQHIRLYKTYDPPGFNPVEYTTDNSVVGAQVNITNGSAVFQFRDTTIVREDKSRYEGDIRAYMSFPFSVQREATYMLNIQTETYDEISTQLTVPREAMLGIGNVAALRSPETFQNNFIILNSTLSSLTRGFQVHAFLEFDFLEDGVWVRKRQEIPTAVRDHLDCQTFRPLFHRLERRKTLQPEQTTFEVQSYMTTLANVWNTHSPFNVRMQQVVFELTEFDPGLYSYLNNCQRLPGRVFHQDR